ncbi:MAG: OmpA family protein [Alphaproteobacteria bacterium]|nr:OmpA family protein [Alphaproteobacteria bacterium]
MGLTVDIPESARSGPTARAPRRMRTVAAIALALALGACDTTRDVVDAANPVNWFEDDEADASAQPVDERGPPGEEGDYPALGTTPERPAPPEIKSRFEELRSGLVADRENARYSDEEVRRTPPPDRARADAAMAALRAEPNEPPTVDAPTAEAAAAPTSPAPAVSAPAPAATPAPSPITAPDGPAPEPAAAPAPDLQEGAATETPQPAPAPEPLSAGQSDAAQQAAPPPESAASLAATAASGSGSGQDASAADAGRLIATIYFPGGGAALTSHDRDILRQVAEIYAQGGRAVQVVGHSSLDGGDPSQQRSLVNYKASLDRASAVAGALAEYGVPRDALSIDARGANQLRYAETTAEGVAGNRRAEVYIVF